VVGPLLAGPLFDLNVEYPLWSGSATLLAGAVLALTRLYGAKKPACRETG
jgi:hypothetical protein